MNKYPDEVTFAKHKLIKIKCDFQIAECDPLKQTLTLAIPLSSERDNVFQDDFIADLKADYGARDAVNVTDAMLEAYWSEVIKRSFTQIPLEDNDADDIKI